MIAMKILVLDVGGTHVKMAATGQDEVRKFASGPDMTPQVMVAKVRKPPPTGKLTPSRSAIRGRS